MSMADGGLTLIIGACVAGAVFLDAFARRIHLPGLVGHVFLGFCISVADYHWQILTEEIRHAFAMLANLGLVALLFQVGLQSHPSALATKLPQAVIIWLGNMLVAGGCGFLAARYLLDLDLIPSLLITVALTATSVGVSIAPWQEAGRLGGETGALLIDVAELDDISAVALLAILMAMAPALAVGSADPWLLAGHSLATLLGKLIGFAVLCWLFVKFCERPLLRFARRVDNHPAHFMLVVIGFGFMIAAGAEALGLSLAIGALFAGLVFGRNPEAIRTEANFEDIYVFVTPFFFINIGLKIDPGALTGAASIGIVLLVAAVVGKLVGTFLPAWMAVDRATALLLAVSMIPRAEIAMVVIDQGQEIGPQIVTGPIYAGMVFVTACTCVVAPTVLYALLSRDQQQAAGKVH